MARLRQHPIGRSVALRLEGRVGKSYALNTGIASTSGDLVGMIDDDEEIDAAWFEVAGVCFMTRRSTLLAAPTCPRWRRRRPRGYHRVRVQHRRLGRPSDPCRAACCGWIRRVLMGGNAIVRRALLRRSGPYTIRRSGRVRRAAWSGRTTTCIFASWPPGRGEYRPDLVIHHFVPAGAPQEAVSSTVDLSGMRCRWASPDASGAGARAGWACRGAAWGGASRGDRDRAGWFRPRIGPSAPVGTVRSR